MSILNNCPLCLIDIENHTNFINIICDNCVNSIYYDRDGYEVNYKINESSNGYMSIHKIENDKFITKNDNQCWINGIKCIVNEFFSNKIIITVDTNNDLYIEYKKKILNLKKEENNKIKQQKMIEKVDIELFKDLVNVDNIIEIKNNSENNLKFENNLKSEKDNKQINQDKDLINKELKNKKNKKKYNLNQNKNHDYNDEVEYDKYDIYANEFYEKYDYN